MLTTSETKTGLRGPVQTDSGRVGPSFREGRARAKPVSENCSLLERVDLVWSRSPVEREKKKKKASRSPKSPYPESLVLNCMCSELRPAPSTAGAEKPSCHPSATERVDHTECALSGGGVGGGGTYVLSLFLTIINVVFII